MHGGPEGKGGRGGSGGGGLGGHSLGIAFVGEVPMQIEVSIEYGTAGDGGIGGDGDASPGAKGQPGSACKTLDFAAEDCVT